MRFNVKAAVALAAIASIAVAQQAPVKFTRAFKEGDSDNYRTSVVANLAGMGAFEMTTDIKQDVKKVFENGDIEVETTIGAPKASFNGQDVPSEMVPLKAGTVKTTLDKGGNTKKTDSEDGMVKMVLSVFSYASYIAEQEFEVGKTIEINRTDPKEPENKVKGTAKLISVENGIATVVTNLDITNKGQTAPMKVDVTSLIEVGSSKPRKIEGILKGVTGPEGVQIESVNFKVEKL